MIDSEIVDYLRKIESKYPVNEWIIQERHIWPLIKLIICSELISVKTSNIFYQRRNIFSKVISKVNNYKDVFRFNNVPVDSSDVLIYHHNVSRNIVLDDNRAFDHNLDPFTLLLESDCKIFSLECMGKSKHYNTFCTSYKVDGVFQRLMIKSKLINMLDTTTVLLDKYTDFLSECASELRIKLREEELNRYITFINLYCDFFVNIIRKSGVRFAIAAGGYGLDTMALFTACNDAGITCMEVQHGLGAGTGHRWYSYWGKMPLNGKRYEMLPDIYWCWTKQDKQVIDSWAGTLHSTYFGRKPIYSILYDLDRLTSKSVFCVERNFSNILFSMQPKVDYPDWLVKFIKDTSKDYNWIIRKHPRFDVFQAKFINKLDGLPNVYIDGVADIMLEKLLVHIDLHITDHSTVAIDALEFGIKTIIIGSGYEDVFGDEIVGGNIFVGNSEIQFKAAFVKCLSKGKRKNYIKSDLYMKNKEYLLSIIKLST